MISRWRHHHIRTTKDSKNSSSSSILPTTIQSSNLNNSNNNNNNNDDDNYYDDNDKTKNDQSSSLSSFFSPSSKSSLPYQFTSPSSSSSIHRMNNTTLRAYNNKYNNTSNLPSSTLPGHIRPITCTNFLMGGQYYPGKDKTKYILRRKTLWYKLFCSTKVRMMGSILILLYFIIILGFLPLIDLIYKYGHLLSRKDYHYHHYNNSNNNNNTMNGDMGNGHVIMEQNDNDVVPSLIQQQQHQEEEKVAVVEEEENDKKHGIDVKEVVEEANDHDFENEEEEEENENEKHNDYNNNIRKELKDDIPKSSSSQQQDVLLPLKPTQILKQNAKLFDEKMKQIQNDPNVIQDKRNLLKQLVPEFYNDSNNEKKNNDVIDDNIKKKNNNNKKKKPKKKNYLLKNEEKDEGKKLLVDQSKQGKQVVMDNDNVNEVGYIQRTLLNQNSHYKFSSCPVDGVEKVSVSLVLQSTLDRLKLLKLTCQRWKSSPLIVSVYLTQEEYDSEWNDIVKEYEHNICNSKTVLIPYISKSNEERTLGYPINLLRNMALDRVHSSHVIVMDIDMIPSENLDSAIQAAIDLAIERRLDDDGDSGVDPLDAIVVPAFERKLIGGVKCDTLEECYRFIDNDDFMPKNLTDLKKSILNEECIVFQSEINWEGHHSTDTNAWIKSSFDTTSTNHLREITCFDSLRYEPYVVIPWCELKTNAQQILMKRKGPRSPYYDERFIGYGKNKIQQISHLRKRGYEFMVIPPTGFITHFPHPISNTKKVWNDRKGFDLHDAMDRLYPKYLNELERVYESSHGEKTKMCPKT